MKAPSQNDQLQALLESKPNRWLPMPRLAKAIGGFAVHSRAADLRKRGLTIEHQGRVTFRDGRRINQSFYRLIA